MVGQKSVVGADFISAFTSIFVGKFWDDLKIGKALIMGQDNIIYASDCQKNCGARIVNQS
jgi:hypothetical protein